jgi:hypothetical protein
VVSPTECIVCASPAKRWKLALGTDDDQSFGTVCAVRLALLLLHAPFAASEEVPKL